MNLEDLKESLEEKGLMLTSSERLELEFGKDEWHESLRNKGYYRVYETYCIDDYDCHQFYATGFRNSEEGNRYLITTNYEDDNTVDLYLVLDTDSIFDRKEKKIATGTEEEILEISKQYDKLVS